MLKKTHSGFNVDNPIANSALNFSQNYPQSKTHRKRNIFKHQKTTSSTISKAQFNFIFIHVG